MVQKYLNLARGQLFLTPGFTFETLNQSVVPVAVHEAKKSGKNKSCGRGRECIRASRSQTFTEKPRLRSH